MIKCACDRGRCGLCFTHPLEKKKQKGRRPPLISLGIFSSFCVVHFYQSTYLQNVIPCKAMLIVVGAWIGPAARNGQLLCLSHIVRTFRVCILTFCFFFSQKLHAHILRHEVVGMKSIFPSNKNSANLLPSFREKKTILRREGHVMLDNFGAVMSTGKLN